VTRKQAPLVKAIQGIPVPLSLTDMEQTIRDPLVTAIRALPQPPTAEAIRDAMTVPPQIEYEEEGATANIEELDAPPKDSQFDYLYRDLDLNKIKDNDAIVLPSTLAKRNNLDEVQNSLTQAERLIKLTKKRITTAEASNKPNKLQRLQKEQANETELNKYIDVLKRMKGFIKGIKGMEPTIGKGLKKLIYGKYIIDKKKLGKGILSISYPNGKKVSGYPNIKVSNDVKKVFMNNKINKTYDLSETEKTFIRDFINRSGADISKSKSKAVCNKSFNRMAVLLGEMNAGNTSPVVKNELAEIAHHFYKNKQLDKDQYSKILSLI
jgi:hypothetical protein